MILILRKKESDLGARMEHAADVGSDVVADVVEGAVVPLRMAGFSPEGLRRRIGLSQEKTQQSE